MSFAELLRETELRQRIRTVLAGPAIQAELAALHGREPDVRPLYRELGRQKLLATGWPQEYGGLGLTHTQTAVVIQEMVRAGVPDMVHVLTVQIVGLFLLLAGSERQRAEHLPKFASGERFATVLYTEHGSGSDLASLTGTATRDADGYVLSGTKVYGLKSGMSDVGLCAMRTGQGRSRYEGISLFLVDLHAPGVRHRHLPSVGDEQFDHVELDNVRVGHGALVGSEGEGWALLNRCLAIERTGLDYLLKAERWFGAAVRGLGPGRADDGLLADIGRHGAAIALGWRLCGDMLERLDRGSVDETRAAMAKYHSSESAQAVARWAAGVHGFGYGLHSLTASDARTLESGYREAAGVTLAAGTSQIMLGIVASGLAEIADREV